MALDCIDILLSGEGIDVFVAADFAQDLSQGAVSPFKDVAWRFAL